MSQMYVTTSKRILNCIVHVERFFIYIQFDLFRIEYHVIQIKN
jgi:hypothetical protein